MKELLGATPPEIAAAEYAEAVKLLGAIPIIEAAREYQKRHPPHATNVSVEQTVKEFLSAKANAGRDGDYVRNLSGQLARFAHTFPCPLGSVMGSQIDAWLTRLNVGARTRANHLAAVRNLVRFAQSRKYLPRDWDELSGIELSKVSPGKIQVFAPAELKKILDYAEQHAPKWLPYLAIRAFSGVRFKEIARLRPENFTRDWIVMDAEITKNNQRRLVPVLPALAVYLRRYPPTLGGMQPAPKSGIGSRLVELQRAAGVANRHNGLRDSYISYRIASGIPVEVAAEESGNSSRMIRRSYREIQLPDGTTITPGLAKEYFGIRPKSVTTLSRKMEKLEKRPKIDKR